MCVIAGLLPRSVFGKASCLSQGEISLLCSVWMGAAVAVLGEVVASFPEKLAVFGGACGLQKVKTEKSLALAFGALHPLLPTAHLFLATCLWRSRDSGFPLVVCKTRWLKEVGLFPRRFSSLVHSSKYWSAP